MTNRLCRKKPNNLSKSHITTVLHYLSKSLQSHLNFIPSLMDTMLVSPVHFQTKDQTWLQANSCGHRYMEPTMKHKSGKSVSSSLAANHTSSPHTCHAFTSDLKHLIRNRQTSSIPEELASASNSSCVDPARIIWQKESCKCRVVQNQSISQETLHKLLVTTLHLSDPDLQSRCGRQRPSGSVKSYPER